MWVVDLFIVNFYWVKMLLWFVMFIYFWVKKYCEMLYIYICEYLLMYVVVDLLFMFEYFCDCKLLLIYLLSVYLLFCDLLIIR